MTDMFFYRNDKFLLPGIKPPSPESMVIVEGQTIINDAVPVVALTSVAGIAIGAGIIIGPIAPGRNTKLQIRLGVSAGTGIVTLALRNSGGAVRVYSFICGDTFESSTICLLNDNIVPADQLIQATLTLTTAPLGTTIGLSAMMGHTAIPIPTTDQRIFE